MHKPLSHSVKNMLYAIETSGITKHFDDITAVNKVSIRVMPGELFGLLGPNGAGKTTLINMLSTMTEPSGGSARVWDFDVQKQAESVRQSIGVVFQDTTLDDHLTGRENLDLHGRLYGLDGKTRKKRIDEVLSLVELTDRAEALVKTYSGGMMRRLEIARGLMHHPHVLFLENLHKCWDVIIILEAICKIEKYTNKLSYEEFRKVKLKQDSAVRNFKIIGEAIPDEIKNRKPEIEWKKIAELRDILAHEDLENVWDVTKNKLPYLKKNTLALLSEEGWHRCI